MRRTPVLALLCLVLAPGWAQDIQVLTATFARNFERAEDLDTRLNVVRDAVASKVQGMGSFFQKVVVFVASKGADLQTETKLQEMAALALGKVADEKVRDARAESWAVFKASAVTGVRVAALRALEATAAGDRALVTSMAEFLESQNKLFATQTKPEPQVVLALVSALGTIHDPGAFRALFAARVLGYSAEITAAADAALLATEGDLPELFGAIIRTGAPLEKRDAFALALTSKRLDQRARAALAEDALRAALAQSSSAADARVLTRELRASAMAVLETARWSRATALAVEHFSTAALEYDRGQVPASYLIGAANGLGAMGTHEAAERLTLYLEQPLNAYRELGKPYDEQIVLSVVTNLKRLGDKVAFATLSYVQYLNYSDVVKRAAKDAISSLKW
jgi:hypothetical protein